MADGIVSVESSGQYPGASMNFDLTRLSRAERIWLWRRRQNTTTGRTLGRGGIRMSMGEAAAYLGVTLEMYRAAENGESMQHEDEVIEAIGDSYNDLTEITLAEQCELARRRSDISLDALCAALGGISRPTLFTREAAGEADLINLWLSRGFSF